MQYTCLLIQLSILLYEYNLYEYAYEWQMIVIKFSQSRSIDSKPMTILFCKLGLVKNVALLICKILTPEWIERRVDEAITSL